MKAFTVLFLAGAAMAQPAHLVDRQAMVCGGTLYSQAQCCSTDVLGVADLDCAVRTSMIPLQPRIYIKPLTLTADSMPKDADDFKSICAATAKSAKCCTLPLATLGILCNDPA